MTPITRPIALFGTTAILALTLAACGGAPNDASVKDYCAAIAQTQNQEAGEKLQEGDWDGLADLLNDAADEIEEVGTPESISDEEREGFEILLDETKEISGDDLKESFEGDGEEDPFLDDLSDDDRKKVEAYQAYESETCAGES